MENFQDKLKQLNSYVEDFWKRAYRDSLTNLMNRAALEDVVLTHFQRVIEQPDCAFALLYMDLNGFKRVNDTLGHNAGDQLLQSVAGRLEELHGDLAFRLGGDEFVVVVSECSSADAALEDAEKIRRRLSETYRVEDKEAKEQDAFVAPSIGVVFCDSDQIARYKDSNEMKNVHDLIGDGDQVMYQAKTLSKMSLFMPMDNGARKLQGRSLALGTEALVKFKFAEHQPILRSGVGVGRLETNGVVFDCNFKFSQYESGEIKFFCQSEPDNPLSMLSYTHAFKLEGTSYVAENGQNCLIAAERLLLSESSTELTPELQSQELSLITSYADLAFTTGLPATVKFHLANLRLPYPPFKEYESLRLTLDTMPVVVGADDVNAHRAQVQKLHATGSIGVTCWLRVNVGSSSQIEKAVLCANRICALLTLLQGSKVSWLSYDVLSSEGCVLSSKCQAAILGKIAEEPSNTSEWSLSYVQENLSKMYKKLSELEGDSTIQSILRLLSTMQTQEDSLESKAYKAFHSFDLLLDYYANKGTIQTASSAYLLSSVAYTQALCTMFGLFKFNYHKQEHQTDELVLSKMIEEVIFLRETLLGRGRLVSPKESTYDPNFERLRRANFLIDLAQNCVKSVLNPSNKELLSTLRIPHLPQDRDA